MSNIGRLMIATADSILLYRSEINITLCDTTLRMQKVANYLGIRFNPRLTLWAQIQQKPLKPAPYLVSLCQVLAV